MPSTDPDPVEGLLADDVCWCGSTLAYSECHGDLMPARATQAIRSHRTLPMASI